MNTKDAFDRIEYGLQEQGYNLGRDYKIGHCNIEDFYIMFCGKGRHEIDITEFVKILHYNDILNFKISHTKQGMRMRLKLKIKE